MGVWIRVAAANPDKKKWYVKVLECENMTESEGLFFRMIRWLSGLCAELQIDSQGFNPTVDALLVACMQLYKSLCPSIHLSIRPSIRRSLFAKMSQIATIRLF